MRTKAFLLEEKDGCYCSICRRKYYSSKKGHKQHELVNELEPIKKEDILYYTVELEDGRIFVKIHNQNEILFTISFDQTGKIQSSDRNELDYWMELIEENFLYEKYQNKKRFLSFSEEECQIINKLFPCIYQDVNIARFIRMISKRKIEAKELNKEKIRKIPYTKINLYVGKKYDKKIVKLCKMKEHIIDETVIFEVIYAIGEVVGTKIMNPEKYRFFISKDFIYNPKEYDLSLIIGNDDRIKIYEPISYTEFHKMYPEVKLKEFLQSGGKDAVRFILSNNNDIIFELVGKAGLGYIAERSDEMEINRNGKNMKEVFGLPIKVLRTLNSPEGAKLLLKDLKEIQKIYKEYPAIFEKRISTSGIHLLEDFGRYSIHIKDDIIKYFRYINSLKDEEYSFYMDYIIMCRQYNLFPYGKFPKMIVKAHDVIMIYGTQKREALKATRFELAIGSLEYKNLEYETGNYKFLLPRTAEDLVKESYEMRNCVRSYIDRVANGYCYIIFLREKRRLSSSYVTIEVDTNYRLRQVKGKGNSRVPKNIAELVKKWCDEKSIDADCYDLNVALGMK